MPKSKRTPIDVARKEAADMIASNTLPTIAELAKKWNCSAFRVSYVLKQVRGGQTKRAAKRGRPARAVVAKRSTKSHPLLKRIRVALEQVEKDLHNVEGYISAIPGLASAEINKLVKKSQAGVWSGLHAELLRATESVAQLAIVRRKKKSKQKKSAKG